MNRSNLVNVDTALETVDAQPGSHEIRGRSGPPGIATTADTSGTNNRRSLRAVLASIYELGEPGTASRLEAMEGLRGLAILLVFLCHYYDIILSHVPLPNSLAKLGLGVQEAGGTGVDLFFVLSGMLIYRAVLKPNMKFGKFMARRAERIYPTFLLVFGIYIVMSIVLVMRPHSTPYDVRIPSGVIPASLYLVANVGFLPGLFPIQPLMNVAWSLSYEWFFYLSLPVIVLITGIRNWKPKSRIVLFSTVAALFLISSLLFPEAFLMTSNPIRKSHIKIIMFFAGMILSDLTEAGVSGTRRWLEWSTAALLLFGLAVPFAVGYSGFRLLPQNRPEVSFTEAIISGSLFFSYGLMVYCALSGSGFINRAFRWAPLRWLGNMSYSFYLLHGLPMHVIALIMMKPFISHLPLNILLPVVAIMLPVTFLVTSAACTLLFAWIEKPLSLKPKKRSPRAVQVFDATAP